MQECQPIAKDRLNIPGRPKPKPKPCQVSQPHKIGVYLAPSSAHGIEWLGHARDSNPPTAAIVVQGSSEGGAFEPLAGDGASPRPQGASNPGPPD